MRISQSSSGSFYRLGTLHRIHLSNVWSCAEGEPCAEAIWESTSRSLSVARRRHHASRRIRRQIRPSNDTPAKLLPRLHVRWPLGINSVRQENDGLLCGDVADHEAPGKPAFGKNVLSAGAVERVICGAVTPRKSAAERLSGIVIERHELDCARAKERVSVHTDLRRIPSRSSAGCREQ